MYSSGRRAIVRVGKSSLGALIYRLKVATSPCKAMHSSQLLPTDIYQGESGVESLINMQQQRNMLEELGGSNSIGGKLIVDILVLTLISA